MTRWYKIQRAVRDSVPRAISKGLHNYANTYVFHGINLPRKISNRYQPELHERGETVNKEPRGRIFSGD